MLPNQPLAASHLVRSRKRQDNQGAIMNPTFPSIAGDLSPLSERPACVVQAYSSEPLQTEGELLALGFAADGTLWSIEEPGLLRHWELASSKQLGTQLFDDVSPVWTFAPGCRLVAGGSDEVTLYDTATGQMNVTFSGFSWVTALAFSPDGRLIASGHDNGSIRIWDIEKRQKLHSLPDAHKSVSALTFSADGKTLVSAGEEKSIHFWDVSKGEPRRTLTGHKDRVPALAFHPSQARLFSAGWDTTVRVWDTNTGEPIILLNNHATQVLAIALSPNGNLLASADSADSIHLWDLERNRDVKVWAGNGAEVRCLAFSPDGRRLACGGADRVILLKDVHRDESSIGPFEGMGLRGGVALTPDGSRLLSLSPGSSLRVWETNSGKPASELKEAGVLRAFALSPDGKTIAGSLAVEVAEERLKHGGTGIPSLFLWDTQTGKRRLLLDGQAPPITTLTFSPNGTLLASASYMKGDVWLWNTTTGQPALMIPQAVESCSIEAMAFHPKGDYLAVGGIDWMATGGSDGAVAVWDLKEKAQTGLFGRGTTCLGFHPSGKQLVTAGLMRTIQVWGMPDGELIAELKGHTEAVTCVNYSPDGRWIASSGDDHHVRLWDARTYALIATVPLDTQVKALTFSAKGEYLFTANAHAGSYQISIERMNAE
jgi:WD40 repeat protein